MMHQGSHEPAAIRFTLDRLQESARRSGYFLPAFFHVDYIGFKYGRPNMHENKVASCYALEHNSTLV